MCDGVMCDPDALVVYLVHLATSAAVESCSLLATHLECTRDLMGIVHNFDASDSYRKLLITYISLSALPSIHFQTDLLIALSLIKVKLFIISS